MVPVATTSLASLVRFGWTQIQFQDSPMYSKTFFSSSSEGGHLHVLESGKVMPNLVPRESRQSSGKERLVWPRHTEPHRVLVCWSSHHRQGIRYQKKINATSQD